MAVAILQAVLLCAVSVGNLRASPVRTYDQRQQGELNIHAQLDNIVIVLVPSSNFNLLGLTGKNKFGEKPDKNDILQFFQKPHKNDIDRYEIVKDENEQNDIKDVSVIASQQVAIVHHGEKDSEKEDEVVATVEEMKPVTTEKATDPPKSEATEDGPIKEHSAIGETVQESVLKVLVPEELKDKIKQSEETKESSSVKGSEENPDKSSQGQHPKQDTISKEREVSSEEVPKKDEPSSTEESSTKSKEESLQKEKETTSPPVAEKKKLTIEDLIRPVAAKEEKTPDLTSTKTTPVESTPSKKSSGLVEGVRKEKVIRYKPESKWAPGLVDMLTSPRAKPTSREVEEKQRFAALCSPGTWDTELKTCIMPGETRSRHELARFLEAMRFGIAIPSQQQ